MDKNKTDNLEDHLVCPICFEIPRFQIYQCRNGHHICQGCSEPIANCPQCRVAYGKQVIRNRAMESLLDAMEFDCPHKARGCSLKIHRNELDTHEGTCTFRPIYFCKMIGFANCKFVVPNIPQLTIAHLKQCHNVTVCHGSNLQLTHENLEACLDRQGEELEVDFGGLPGDYSKNFKWEPILWKLEEDDYSPTFLILCRIRGAFFRPKLFSWACLYMGESVEEAMQYQVDFSIRNVFGNGQKSQLTWNNPPTPFRSAENLLKEPRFTVPFSFLTDHVNKDVPESNVKNSDELKVHVKISKLPKKIVQEGDERESDFTKLHILPMLS